MKTIRAKLIFLSIVVCASIVVISLIGLLQIKYIEEAYTQSQIARDIQSQIQILNIAITSVLLVNDTKTRDESKKLIQSSMVSIRNLLETIRKKTRVVDSHIDELMKLLPELDKAYKQIIELCEAETFEIATNIFLSIREKQDKLFALCQRLVDNYIKNASSRTKYMRMVPIGVGIIAVVLMFMVSFSMMKNITFSIKNGLRIAERLSEGDLNIENANFGSDEIGRLAKALKSTGINLKELLAQIKFASEKLASSAEELSAGVTQMSSCIREQIDKSNQVAVMSAQLSASVGEIAKNVFSMDKNAEQTFKLANEGKEMMLESVSEMDKIKNIVEDLSSSVFRLKENSAQIWQVVKVINDIADQTNLLALNAAIEAARAGEHGKGFAVVADEVRKLAIRTQEATMEIEKTINDIKMEIESVKTKMDTVNETVKGGTGSIRKASETFSEIVMNFNNIKSMIQNIASATEEISSASESAKADVEHIAAVTRENGATSEQIASASADLAKLAEELRTSLSRFRIA